MPVSDNHPASRCSPLRREQTPGGPLILRWSNLRYVLTMNLSINGTMTVKELAALLTQQGFATAGRPSKCISDALRTERSRGRVWRRGRGRYGPGSMPRSTEYRIQQRYLELRAKAQARQEQQAPQTGAA